MSKTVDHHYLTFHSHHMDKTVDHNYLKFHTIWLRLLITFISSFTPYG